MRAWAVSGGPARRLTASLSLNGQLTLALSRENHQVLESEAKMGRQEVLHIVRDSVLWGWSNGWIQRYADRLRIVG